MEQFVISAKHWLLWLVQLPQIPTQLIQAGDNHSLVYNKDGAFAPTLCLMI